MSALAHSESECASAPIGRTAHYSGRSAQWTEKKTRALNACRQAPAAHTFGAHPSNWPIDAPTCARPTSRRPQPSRPKDNAHD